MARSAVGQVEYQPALTGLRALAATLVFFHHFYGQWHGGSGGVAGEWLREGYIGVSIFFTLSGYLITRTYLDRFVAGRITFGEYWLRRFSRVFPAYLALLLVKFAVEPGSVSGFGQFLANITLAQGFFASTMWTGIAPAWSLTIEESFYLLAPTVYLAMARVRAPLHRSYVVIGITVALWFSGVAVFALKPSGDFLSSQFNIQVYSIFGRFGEFAIGVLAALLIRPSSARAASLWLKESAFLAFFASICLTIFALIHVRLAAGTYYGIVAPGGLFTFWIIAAGTAALIWAVVAGSPLARALLGNRALEYLGRTSYAFYLVQDRFFSERMHALVLKWTPWSPDDPLISFIALNVLAACVYQFIEKPTHGWLLGRFSATASQPRKKSRSPARARARS